MADLIMKPWHEDPGHYRSYSEGRAAQRKADDFEIEQLRDENERLRAANVRLQEALVADPVDQSAEIDRLRAERDELGVKYRGLHKDATENLKILNEAQDQIERLRAALARVRWLVEEEDGTPKMFVGKGYGYKNEVLDRVRCALRGEE